MLFSKVVDEVYIYRKRTDIRGNYFLDNKVFNVIYENRNSIEDFESLCKSLLENGIYSPKNFLKRRYNIYSLDFLKLNVGKVEESIDYLISLLNDGDFEDSMNTKIIDMRKDDQLFYRLMGIALNKELEMYHEFKNVIEQLTYILNYGGAALIKRIIRDFILRIAQITEKKFDTGKVFSGNLEKENDDLKNKLNLKKEDIKKEILTDLYFDINNERTNFILDKIMDIREGILDIEDLDKIALKAIFSSLIKSFNNLGIESIGTKNKKIYEYNPQYYSAESEYDNSKKYLIKKRGWRIDNKVLREAIISENGGEE